MMKSWMLLIFIASGHVVTASVYSCSFNQCKVDKSNINCNVDFSLTNTNKLKWQYVKDARYDNRDSETGGGIMKMESRTAESGEFAGIEYKITMTAPEQCIVFFYNIRAKEDSQCNGGRLKVLVKCGNDEKEVYRSSQPVSYKWEEAVFNIKGNVGDICTITIDAGRGVSEVTTNYVWLDDFIVHDQKCTKTSPTPYSLTNSFAKFRGIWTPTPTGKSWPFGRWNSPGYKASKGENQTGIYRSVTSHHAYIFTRPSVANSVASLKSGTLYFDAPTCLRFFVWRRGDNAPELTVKVNSDTKFKNTGVPSNGFPVDSMKWKDVAVTLPAKNDFVVEIEAKTKEVSNDDFGIDNLFVQNGACATESVYDCNFETDCDADLTKVANKRATHTKENNQLKLHFPESAKSWYSTWLDTYVEVQAAERSVRGWCLTFGVKIGADSTKCKLLVQFKYKRGDSTKEYWGHRLVNYKYITSKTVQTWKIPVYHLLGNYDRRLERVRYRVNMKNNGECKEFFYDSIKLTKGLCEMENMV